MTDLRTLENDSIRAFVQSAADEGYLSGRVLDYGCGKQPYRDIVEAAGGRYEGFDRVDFPASTASENHPGPRAADPLYRGIPVWSAILCTQVIQYVPLYEHPNTEHDYNDWPHDPARDLLEGFHHLLRNKRGGGHLVLTYPTNWPETEPEDLHRFTKAGMERLLTEAGFTIVRHERRAEMANRSDVFALGYGVICRA